MAFALPPPIPVAVLDALAAQHAPDVHPRTVLHIVEHESKRHPLAIGVKGAQLAYQPRSLAQAVATARELRRQGRDFDAGLCQINIRNWRWLNLDEVNVFDPARNLAACQRVLLDCWSRAPGATEQHRLRSMFSCFNTGGFYAGFQNGYVTRVLRAPVAVPTSPAAPEAPL